MRKGEMMKTTSFEMAFIIRDIYGDKEGLDERRKDRAGVFPIEAHFQRLGQKQVADRRKPYQERGVHGGIP